MRVAEVDGAGGGGRRPAQRPATKQISQEASLGSMAPARLAHLSRPFAGGRSEIDGWEKWGRV